MTNHWVWVLDEDDDDDYTDFSDVPSQSQKVGMLAINKMKISGQDDDKVPEKIVKLLNEEEEVIEDLRAAGIEYKDNLELDPHFMTKCKNWEEEHKSKIVSQGRVPVFIGKEHFFTTKMQPKSSKTKSNKSKKDRNNKSKKIISKVEGQGTNPFCHNVVPTKETNPFRLYPELKCEINPFGPSKEAESNGSAVHVPVDESKENEVPKYRRMTVAQQIVKSVHLQSKNKKKSFKDFEAATNFNPDPTEPTIGMANHKCYTPRELYFMHRLTK